MCPDMRHVPASMLCEDVGGHNNTKTTPTPPRTTTAATTNGGSKLKQQTRAHTHASTCDDETTTHSTQYARARHGRARARARTNRYQLTTRSEQGPGQSYACTGTQALAHGCVHQHLTGKQIAVVYNECVAQ
mmetsp:Transcript_55565/g.92349  ORF Transcript_55565/g.92349 Transcript_55565/m.92349 type:complete len:132 (+) Transcript_55565:1384-1779(+)